MTCSYCRSINSEADHRCRRCGRRLEGSAVAAPPEYADRAVRSLGANALAAAAATVEMEAPRTAVPVRMKPKPAQPSLFTEENPPKVISFVSRFSETSQALPDTAELFPPKSPAEKQKAPPKARKSPDSRTLTDLSGDQTTLDFLPTLSPQKSRTLKTTVEAVIYCDAKVASPVHRSMAAALDSAMIFLGLGIFLAIFLTFGGAFPWNKQNVLIFLGAMGLISMFYGFLWVLAGRETMGMSWADLRIVNFNGFPPDRKSRALRMVGCWLSFCSGMIGILWALVDEESLTWHDHMSKTFPTLRETDSRFIRQ